MAPVNAGLIRYTDLINGGLTLFDIFIMNDFLQYKSDYETAMYDVVGESR
jgi:hypothetical protein